MSIPHEVFAKYSSARVCHSPGEKTVARRRFVKPEQCLKLAGPHEYRRKDNFSFKEQTEYRSRHYCRFCKALPFRDRRKQ